MPARAGVNIGTYLPTTYEDGSGTPTFDDLMRLIIARPPLSPYPVPVADAINQLASATGYRQQALAQRATVLSQLAAANGYRQQAANPGVAALPGLFGGGVPLPARPMSVGAQNLPGLFGGTPPQTVPTSIPMPVHPFFRAAPVAQPVHPSGRFAPGSRGR